MTFYLKWLSSISTIINGYTKMINEWYITALSFKKKSKFVEHCAQTDRQLECITVTQKL